MESMIYDDSQVARIVCPGHDLLICPLPWMMIRFLPRLCLVLVQALRYAQRNLAELAGGTLGEMLCFFDSFSRFDVDLRPNTFAEVFDFPRHY